MAEIASVRVIVGMEVHVELATRTKMFSRAPSIAAPGFELAAAGPTGGGGANGMAGMGGVGPNTCIDPLVLGLPGALPVLNRRAVEMSIMVGLALGCRIAEVSRWDRKSYFYPDMPKNYQISQYDLPLCFDGAVDLDVPPPPGAAAEPRSVRIGILRAHLEEDAGKLLHEAPGGAPIDFSIVDLNRAGTPLLEIVTQPDFASADECVAFAHMLRDLVRFLGVSEGVLQRGHMRFEPNINTVLTLADGRVVRTPIVEVKNLNSFKALRGAIDFEAREQPLRWRRDGREAAPGAKSTRGWDDDAAATTPQREKEEAADYRYFPDPDLLPVRIDPAWRQAIEASLPELPAARRRRYIAEHSLHPKEAAALVEERGTCLLFEAALDAAVRAGLSAAHAGKAVANLLLQSGAKRANERTAAAGPAAPPVLIHDLGITPAQLGGLALLRESDRIGSGAADELFGLLCDPASAQRTAEDLAQERGLLTVRDDAALDAWCQQAILEHPKAADDVRAGKDAALGRLVGAAMKASAARADAKAVRERLLALLRP